MNEEAFEKVRVPGEINWDDACVIRDAIVEQAPETILELGCFRGMSTLVIIDAMPDDCKFTSVDIKKMGEKYSFASDRGRSELVPLDAPVTHIVSDALKYLQGLPDGSYDLIFEDTNHQTRYTQQLIPEILRVLKSNRVALFHDLNLGTMRRAFKKEGLEKKVILFPPSRMGMLRKKRRTWE